MRRLLLLGMIVPALGMAADRVMEDEHGNFIEIGDEPCVSESEMLKTIPPKMRAKMKRSTTWWKNRLYEGCWMDLGDGRVFVYDEAGDAGVLQESSFRLKHGT